MKALRFSCHVSSRSIFVCILDTFTTIVLLTQIKQGINHIMGNQSSSSKAVVTAVMQGWGEGKLNGPGALDFAKSVTTDDCVLDATANGGIPNTPEYKIYNGPQGIVDWCNFVNTSFEYPDHQVHQMVAEGDTVCMFISYTPTCKATGKKGTLSHDMSKWVVKNGKVSHCKFYFGNTKMINEILAK